jgi:hypothetical protein
MSSPSAATMIDVTALPIWQWPVRPSLTSPLSIGSSDIKWSSLHSQVSAGMVAPLIVEAPNMNGDPHFAIKTIEYDHHGNQLRTWPHDCKRALDNNEIASWRRFPSHNVYASVDGAIITVADRLSYAIGCDTKEFIDACHRIKSPLIPFLHHRHMDSITLCNGVVCITHEVIPRNDGTIPPPSRSKPSLTDVLFWCPRTSSGDSKDADTNSKDHQMVGTFLRNEIKLAKLIFAIKQSSSFITLLWGIILADGQPKWVMALYRISDGAIIRLARSSPETPTPSPSSPVPAVATAVVDEAPTDATGTTNDDIKNQVTFWSDTHISNVRRSMTINLKGRADVEGTVIEYDLDKLLTQSSIVIEASLLPSILPLHVVVDTPTDATVVDVPHHLARPTAFILPKQVIVPACLKRWAATPSDRHWHQYIGRDGSDYMVCCLDREEENPHPSMTMLMSYDGLQNLHEWCDGLLQARLVIADTYERDRFIVIMDNQVEIWLLSTILNEPDRSKRKAMIEYEEDDDIMDATWLTSTKYCAAGPFGRPSKVTIHDIYEGAYKSKGQITSTNFIMPGSLYTRWLPRQWVEAATEWIAVTLVYHGGLLPDIIPIVCAYYFGYNINE